MKAFDVFMLVSLAVAVTFSVTFFCVDDSVNTAPSRQERLPNTCRPGQQIIFTSAPNAELYVCESHWVRK